MIFNSCQEDDPTPSAAAPSSALCGSATFTARLSHFQKEYTGRTIPSRTNSQIMKVNGFSMERTENASKTVYNATNTPVMNAKNKAASKLTISDLFLIISLVPRKIIEIDKTITPIH